MSALGTSGPLVYYLCLSCSQVCYCCNVVTCCERADHLALVCDVPLCFCHFPMRYTWSGVGLYCIDS